MISDRGSVSVQPFAYTGEVGCLAFILWNEEPIYISEVLLSMVSSGLLHLDDIVGINDMNCQNFGQIRLLADLPST